ncbi:hypothetical protein ALC57_14096 [Trachymyrmex cornetzi]|uniref:Uncharacterized protein n=1 Tax=Trachymyrmex cornetzi TaxID=471704 RepID=A0A151IYV1_9HYME|nr:hypothetical protein ALC57_14096 [Trachymyrmex cornetzi]
MQLSDSSSKIVHRSSSKKIVKASYYDDDKSSKQTMIFIKSIPAPKGPLTRVIQCSTKISKDKTNYCIHLESKLKKDSAYKIIQPTDSSKISVKKTKISCKGALSKQSVSRRKSKSEVTRRSLPDCKLARSDKADLKIDILFFPEMKDPLSHITCKNGFDPFEIPSSLKKFSRRYKKQICSSSCYQPVRSATKDVCSDFFPTKVLALHAKSSPTERCTMQKRLDSQRLQRLPSKQILRSEVTQIEYAKSDKASACQKSAVAFRRACLTPEISGDTSHLPSSQELLTRYGKNIPIYQLERYEACRSKRNGLQDECIPPLLQAILKKEEQQRTLDKCSKGEQKVDQNRMGESMNPIKFLLYVE